MDSTRFWLSCKTLLASSPSTLASWRFNKLEIICMLFLTLWWTSFKSISFSFNDFLSETSAFLRSLISIIIPDMLLPIKFALRSMFIVSPVLDNNSSSYWLKLPTVLSFSMTLFRSEGFLYNWAAFFAFKCSTLSKLKILAIALFAKSMLPFKSVL